MTNKHLERAIGEMKNAVAAAHEDYDELLTRFDKLKETFGVYTHTLAPEQEEALLEWMQRVEFIEDAEMSNGRVYKTCSGCGQEEQAGHTPACIVPLVRDILKGRRDVRTNNHHHR